MKLLLFALLSSALIFFACKKDEDCDPGSLETNIVGEWTLTVAGLDYGDVEFRANGTLIDPDSIIINPDAGTGEIFDLLSYEVMSDSEFTAYATNAAGNTTLYSDYEVDSYTCDEIVLGNFIVVAKLTRK